MAIISCKKKEETFVPPPPPSPIETPAPESPPITDEEKDRTSIKVGSDGFDISTKDGKNKTNVNIYVGFFI